MDKIGLDIYYRGMQPTYEWIDFANPVQLEPINLKLGEAFSKCQHLAGIPLPPRLADELASLYFARGVHGTTSIEGNTMSQEDVQQFLAGRKFIPDSRSYLAQEVSNVADALLEIRDDAAAGEVFRLTPEWICRQNAQVLKGMEDLEEHVVPGEFSKVQVGVANYRPPAPAHVPALVDQLCEWLNTYISASQDPERSSDERFVNAFIGAVVGHLYVAWIHPFGDGNGRTARLLEAAILAHSGVVPWVSCQLLSNFYNLTRNRYYSKLDRASRHQEVSGFINYSIEGYVDELREQIELVNVQQREIAWISLVHEVMQAQPEGKPKKRRTYLALALPDQEPIAKTQIPTSTTALAFHYAEVTSKTLSRDLSTLESLGLAVKVAGGWVANRRALDAFIPLKENFSRTSVLVSAPDVERDLLESDVETLAAPNPQL